MMSFKNDATLIFDSLNFIQSKMLDCFIFLFQKDLES